MKTIKFLLEIIGWCQIAFGTTAIAALLAALLYFLYPTSGGKIVAVIIIAAGFILGSIWATKIWRKSGTIEWLSRISRIS